MPRWTRAAAAFALLLLAACPGENPAGSDKKEIDDPSKHETLLRVAILGPDEVQPGAVCTWTAQVSGGLPPYTYSWIGFHLASGIEESFSDGTTREGNHRISLEVGDATEARTRVYKQVHVSPLAPPC